MKRNATDNYWTTEDPLILEDGITGEQLIFIIDSENRLVIRSFFEEDIKEFVKHFDATSKEKREKIKLLSEEIPKAGSEEHFFAIEKIEGEENKEEWDAIYSLPRTPIGLMIRTEETCTLTERIGPEIQAQLYTGYEKMIDGVVNMMQILAKRFGIKGTVRKIFD